MASQHVPFEEMESMEQTGVGMKQVAWLWENCEKHKSISFLSAPAFPGRPGLFPHTSSPFSHPRGLFGK